MRTLFYKSRIEVSFVEPQVSRERILLTLNHEDVSPIFVVYLFAADGRVCLNQGER